MHSDIETDKVAALHHSPRAALNFWLPQADLQIRLVADVDILTGPDVEDQWIRIPPGARVSYGTQPVPGTPISEVFDYEKPAEQSRFAVLNCRVQTIDLVHLGTRHRRAQFLRDDDWKGTWVAP